MTIIFEAEAELQLYYLAQIIDDLNISGAGARWINKFLDYLTSHAKPNVAYALCHHPELALKGYSCITYNDKWVVAFKLTKDELRVYEILHGALLK